MNQKKTQQLEAISMLEKNEHEVARLYDVFAARFPEFGDFWKDRADDERAHEGLIHAFYERVASGDITLKDRDFKTVEIKYCLKKVRNQVDFCEAHEISLISAFQRAAETERDMLEKHLFETAGDDDTGLAGCLEKLRKDTEEHAAKFREMIKKL